MSSSTPITTTTTTTATFMDPPTHRCNSCNADIINIHENVCRRCNSYIPSNNHNPNPNHPSIQTTTTSDSTVTASDDNFLLDSPYLHRLIHHLTHPNHATSSSTTVTTTSRYHSPTSKSAIESIPLVKINSEFLEIDPVVLCAVCKDQFVVNDEAKQLPCKHMYHSDCILPWLVNHNSCPVCRYEMPREVGGCGAKVRRRSRSRVLRLGMEEGDDEAMLGIGFRNLRRQYLESEAEMDMELELEIDGDSMVSVSDVGERGVLRDWRRARNVSGWRNWPVNGVAVRGGDNVSGWRDWPVNRRDVDGGNGGWLDDDDDDIANL